MFRKLAVLESMSDPMTGMKKAMKYVAEILKTNKTQEMKESEWIQVTFKCRLCERIPFFGNFRVCYWNTIHIKNTSYFVASAQYSFVLA